MIENSNIKEPNRYSAALGKDAIEYLRGFTETARLKGSYQKNPEVKECYKWCEAHLGTKYRDWFMLQESIHFKNNKGATLFRLMWGHLIADSQSSLDRTL